MEIRSELMSHLEKVDLYQRIINELRPFEGEMLKQVKDFLRLLHVPLPGFEHNKGMDKK